MKKIRFTNIDTNKLYRFPYKSKLPVKNSEKLCIKRPEVMSRKCCSRRIIFASGAGLSSVSRLKEVKIKFVLHRQ